jgi:hypothetical protein
MPGRNLLAHIVSLDWVVSGRDSVTVNEVPTGRSHSRRGGESNVRLE